MEVNVKVKPNLQIQPFYLFFVITGIQIGVGILGSPRLIYLEALQDSWISIIISYLYMALVIAAMFYILNQYENADLLGIQIDLFGRWIGKLLGILYLLYFLLAMLSVLVTYAEIVRVFLFPNMSNVLICLLLIILTVYTALGGIRVAVGVCFIFFFLSMWLLLLLIEPLTLIDLHHFQPVFNASVTELLKGAHTTTYTLLGVELLFFIYPFVQNKRKAKLPVYLASLYTTLILLLFTIITIGFFSLQQIERREWAVLALFKIPTFPFIERFDYIVVAEWMMVILPNLVLLVWVITYGMKRLYQIPQKVSLYVVAGLMLASGYIFIDHFLIQRFIDFVSKVGFWIVFVYPFILLPFVMIKKRMRKKKEMNRHAQS